MRASRLVSILLLLQTRGRLTGLTAAEAEALQFAGMPGAAAELGLGTVLATAQLKLDAALPPELRERSARIAERFFLDAPGWYHDGDSSPQRFREGLSRARRRSGSRRRDASGRAICLARR